MDQSLGRFRALVGPNASGKTTSLDVIAFLGNLVKDRGDLLRPTLALKVDYGFASTRPKSISICDEQVRYLHAVSETALLSTSFRSS